MAFKRTPPTTFKATVTVNVANETGGYDKNTFVAVFKYSPTDEHDELRKLSNTELIARKLVGWELKDADTKDDVPFTPENVAALMLIPPTPLQTVIAFWETVNGARAKN